MNEAKANTAEVSDPTRALPATPATGKGLELQFTVEDANVFTMPWWARIIYQRPLGDWPEMICAENPHHYFPGKTAAIPIADKPDF
jgi:hypothetical protein